MKKRIVAIVLAIVLVVCALPITASAESSLQTSINSAVSSKRYLYSITSDTVVNEDTTVPAGFTLYLGYGVKLTLNAKLTVNGTFVYFGTVAGSDKLIAAGGTVNGCTGCTGYNFYYPYSGNSLYYPYLYQLNSYDKNGTYYCPLCNRFSVKYCSDCGYFHCTSCYNHNVIGGSNYCEIHHHAKTYCPICRGYYCIDCTSVHTHSGTDVNQYYCTKHNTWKTYCAVCNSYYCPLCTPSHTHSGSSTNPTVGYCAKHGSAYVVYCPTCGYAYCTKCYPNHTHTTTGVIPKCSLHGSAYMTYCLQCGAYYCSACYPYHSHTVNYCTKHNTYMTWCATCGKYVCPICEPNHTHQTSETYYCSTHKCYKVYCPTCNAYFCPQCETHKHNGETIPYCTTHNRYEVYCATCKKYYCTACEGVHNHSAVVTPVNYCSIHKIQKVYCPICGVYYCPSCTAVHVHTSQTNGYDYYWYVYMLSQGYFTNYYTYNPNGYYNYFTTGLPYASVVSGSTVQFNSTVTLTTATTGAAIYYTLDGTTPTSSSTLYTAPIAINKTDITIKAIAIKSGLGNSPVVTFNYKTTTPISYTDIAAYKNLLPSLVTLVQAKIIEDSKTLNPTGTVSYTELLALLKAAGADSANAVINEAYIANKDALTYEDVAYVAYRVLRKAGVVSAPKFSSTETLAKLKYGSEVTKVPSIVRAGIMSMIDADMLYTLDFHPKAAATRADVLYMTAEVYNSLH